MTPIDVVILAAGRGSRLAELGDDRPKWLLDVAGTTIADRQLAALEQLRPGTLRSVTVVTGHAAEALKALELPQGHNLLHNADYLTYNNWYSVLVALRALPDDARVVVMNGDLCASPEWIGAFLEDCASTGQEGQLAIDFARDLTEESMKVSMDPAGNLHTIGKHPFAEPVGEYVGLLMATGSVLAAFRAQLEAFCLDADHAQQWYEGAVGLTAAAGTPWHLWSTPSSAWVEIDDGADLARAASLVG
jgi:choline kinase